MKSHELIRDRNRYSCGFYPWGFVIPRPSLPPGVLLLMRTVAPIKTLQQTPLHTTIFGPLRIYYILSSSFTLSDQSRIPLPSVNTLFIIFAYFFIVKRMPSLSEHMLISISLKNCTSTCTMRFEHRHSRMAEHEYTGQLSR